MSKVLVTGGGGYLGSVLVPWMLVHQHEVTVLDNFMYRQHGLANVCNHKNFKVVRGDVRDNKLVGRLAKEHDIIIPLAAIVGAPACDRDQVAAITTNQGAICELVDACRNRQKIILPNTNSGYGSGNGNDPCIEDSPLKPLSLYAKTKQEAENAVLKDYDNGISLRLATVFGVSSRMRMDLLVNDFVYRAWHDKSVVLFEAEFVRNYIHVHDVALAFIHCITNFEAMKGKAYNVGMSSANLSKLELCKIIQQQIDFNILLGADREDPDKRNYIVSNARIEATGWSPRYTLADGISELVKYYEMTNVNSLGNV